MTGQARDRGKKEKEKTTFYKKKGKKKNAELSDAGGEKSDLQTRSPIKKGQKEGGGCNVTKTHLKEKGGKKKNALKRGKKPIRNLRLETKKKMWESGKKKGGKSPQMRGEDVGYAATP